MDLRDEGIRAGWIELDGVGGSQRRSLWCLHGSQEVMAEQAAPVSHSIVVSSRGWALREAEAISRRTSGWPWGEPVAYMHSHPRPGPFLLGPTPGGASQACGLPPLAWGPSSPPAR